jgi:hypothetical protein
VRQPPVWQQIWPGLHDGPPLQEQLPEVMLHLSPASHWSPLHMQRLDVIEQLPDLPAVHCDDAVHPQRMSMH